MSSRSRQAQGDRLRRRDQQSPDDRATAAPDDPATIAPDDPATSSAPATPAATSAHPASGVPDIDDAVVDEGPPDYSAADLPTLELPAISVDQPGAAEGEATGADSRGRSNRVARPARVGRTGHRPHRSHIPHRLHSYRLGLRARITLAFGLGALLLSVLLAGTTYLLTRENLLNQRESSTLTQVFSNARIVRSSPIEPERAIDLLSSLQTPTGSRPVLYFAGAWFPLSADYGQSAIPAELRDKVIGGQPARMRYTLRGDAQLVVGVPLPAADAAYFEIVDLSELDRTLRSLGISLTITSLLTTIAGAGLGAWAARRALRPLSDVSQAAGALAGGRLDTRLERVDDSDLDVLIRSFNDMASALQERIERDARFASDVSHELRSPLMTLAASIEILDTRRDELSERSAAALDLLVEEVSRFQQLVEDLLEISRFDAGAARLELDEVRIAELVMQAVEASTEHDVPIELDAKLAGVVVEADKRRLVRVIANLLDNAAKYGDGATSVSIRLVGSTVQIAVEDSGPGVPPDERRLVFERFARGGVAGRRGSGQGVGLGLALVSEHVRLHGGRVWVEGRTDGEHGARFVVEMPVIATSQADGDDEMAE